MTSNVIGKSKLNAYTRYKKEGIQQMFQLLGMLFRPVNVMKGSFMNLKMCGALQNKIGLYYL